MRKCNKTRSGFTLLEVAISITVLVTITLAATATVDRSQGAWSTSVTANELNSVSQIALDRIARDLKSAVRGSLTPNVTLPGQSTSTLDYRGNSGWVAGAVVPGAINRLTLELDSTELDDGIDNNSNGVIDERVLVWSDNPGTVDERRSRRASFVAELLEGELPNGIDDNGNGLVDEPGFCIQIDGNTLNLRLTLQRLSPGGAVMTSTVETSVLVRN